MKFRDCQSSVVSSFSTLPSRIRHNAILQLAIPSVVTNITVPLLGLVDMTVVGHMGHHEYIGAIAIGTTIFNMIYWLFAFLRMGTTGIASQAYGAGDEAALRRTLSKGVRMALGFSTVMLLLQTPLLRLSLWLMQPDATMGKWTSDYFRVCIWGAPAMLLSFVLTGWFIGRQDTRTPMWTAILQNTLNILCTLIFVFVFDMNVRGVALGTVAGLYGGCLFAAFRALRATGIKSQAKGVQSGDGGSKVSVYTDIFLRTLCLVAVTVSFTSMGSRMGGIYLDANALLMQFFIVFSYFTDGLANAAEALSGKYYGAHDAIRLRSTVRQLFLMGSVLAIVFTTFYAIGLGMLLRRCSVLF